MAVEDGAKKRIVTLFCAAGIVSAALTPEFLKFLPEPDPEVPIDALVNPAIPFALLMLLIGIVLAQRGLLTLPHPPGLGELVVGTCVIAFGYFGARQTFGSVLLGMAVLVPVFDALPLALFAAGIVAAGFAGGAVRIVTGETPRRLLARGLAFGACIAVLGVASRIGIEKLDISHLKVLLVGEPVLALVIGDWLASIAETHPVV